MFPLLIRRLLAVMAHATTTIAFGTAIWGVFFPAQAADYVSRFLDEVQGARVSLKQIESSSVYTATATTALADRMAERPRFTSESHLTRPGGVFGDGTAVHQFQMQLENLTDVQVTDLVIIIRTADGQMVSNFLANTIPPYEIHSEIAAGVVDLVCYSYAWNGKYITETRRLEISPSPVIDQMGNAATYYFNHFGYDLIEEADGLTFSCEGNRFGRADLAARQAEIDAAAK